MLTYHEIRNLSPKKAREVVKSVLRKNNNNVSKTARILKIERKTVRRARDGTEEDQSRRPHFSPNKINSVFENLIILEGRKTRYRYRRLMGFIWDKYNIFISENTIKAVLKRNQIQKKIIRTANKRRRPLYDYENLAPFMEMQVDTKHILDLNALPDDVYRHIMRNKFPNYEYNIIDVVTKTRFTAYSHELSSVFGWMFMLIVVNWLRAHGIRHHINIQGDNGTEFCKGSKRKERELNNILNPLGASFVSIPAGKKYLQGVIENSHRHDDEQFLSIHPIRCRSVNGFIKKAQRWQDTWNIARRTWGIGMKGKTPLQKLKQKDDLINAHIMQFPVVLMENILKLSGSYVHTNYPNLKIVAVFF